MKCSDTHPDLLYTINKSNINDVVVAHQMPIASVVILSKLSVYPFTPRHCILNHEKFDQAASDWITTISSTLENSIVV